ncbi:hypothetical protein J3R30DRAFT_1323282 [Lentinula aciculospora]|uniref:DUF1776-domain-containing protein n=1 Tax=Lentinula aciculospora TaxID=153920 RepID=A0A9W9AKX9_9AGAR|nr:hypothetical protein J3R30DRAFT_1323282 [Lentinula aciculospora]
MDNLNAYLTAFAEYISTSLESVGLKESVRESMEMFWGDVGRYGVDVKDLRSRIGLGDFEIPPPPPPLPMVAMDKGSWVDRWGPWIVVGGCVLVAGVGIGVVGYQQQQQQQHRRRRLHLHPFHLHSLQHKKHQSAPRRQTTIILGGSTSSSCVALIKSLEQHAYIVIVSVGSVEEGRVLEGLCRSEGQGEEVGGFVQSVVLSTNPGGMEIGVQNFLRAVASTLDRRFPINGAGDPYVSFNNRPYIHSVISLLTLPTFHSFFPSSHPLSSSSNPPPNSSPIPPTYAPFEHISLPTTYISHLTQTQIIPLQIIQSLLPLMRSNHVPSDAGNPKSVVVCVSTRRADGGVFEGVQNMTTSSTLQAAQTLRMEIELAAEKGKSEGMKNVTVVVVDVDDEIFGVLGDNQGVFGAPPTPTIPTIHPEDIYKAMENWTPSEKLTYGQAFVDSLTSTSTSSPPTSSSSLTSHSSSSPLPHTSISNPTLDSTFLPPPPPTPDSTPFVQTILGVVSNGRYGHGFGWFSTVGNVFGIVFGWRRSWWGSKKGYVRVRSGRGGCEWVSGWRG